MVLQSARPGAHASVRNIRVSAFKARPVLRLIQGESYEEAVEILKFCERGAADVVAKCLRSAAANAEHNEGIDPEELFVFSCFADEGPTLRRWRPRARGRATRIHKRTCHITIHLMRYTPEELAERAARESTTSSAAAEARRRRVAASRGEDEALEDDGLEDESLEEAEALGDADDADILTPALEQAQNDAGLEDIGALGDPEEEDSSENFEAGETVAVSEDEGDDAEADGEAEASSGGEGTDEADDTAADDEAEASSDGKKSKSEKSKSKDS